MSTRNKMFACEFCYDSNFCSLSMQVGEYWLKKYDWKASGEKTLNNMGSHFKTRIDGLDVHFVRARPDPKETKGKKVLPLLIVHGWPGE